MWRNVVTETEISKPLNGRSRPHVTQTSMNVKRFFGKVIQKCLIIVDGERNYKEHRHLQEPNDPQCANRILTSSFSSGMTKAERMTCSLLLSNHGLGRVRESETAHRSTHLR